MALTGKIISTPGVVGTIRPQVITAASAIGVSSNARSIDGFFKLDEPVNDGAMLIFDDAQSKFLPKTTISNSNTTILGGGF